MNQERSDYVKQQARQAYLDFNRSQREQWLEFARETAIKLIQEKGECSADDIHRHCPIPEGIDPRIMGSVWKGMKLLRYEKSNRSICHHRPIGVFSL